MELKELILVTAGKLFYQYGIKAVSMDEISSALGISKRTLYEQYSDKASMLAAFIDYKHQNSLEETKQYYYESKGNTIQLFLMILESHSQTDFPTIKFFDDIQKYYPQISTLFIEHHEENNEKLINLFKEGIENGYLRPNLNVEVAAFLIDDARYTYIRAAYSDKSSFTPRELFFGMMINFLRGISTQKGIEIIDAYLESKQTKI